MGSEVKAEFRELITGLTFDRKDAIERILDPLSCGESGGAIERLSDTLDTVVEVLARLIAGYTRSAEAKPTPTRKRGK